MEDLSPYREPSVLFEDLSGYEKIEYPVNRITFSGEKQMDNKKIKSLLTSLVTLIDVLDTVEIDDSKELVELIEKVMKFYKERN